jgi:fatty acid desaturase
VLKIYFATNLLLIYYFYAFIKIFYIFYTIYFGYLFSGISKDSKLLIHKNTRNLRDYYLKFQTPEMLFLVITSIFSFLVIFLGMKIASCLFFIFHRINQDSKKSKSKS